MKRFLTMFAIVFCAFIASYMGANPQVFAESNTQQTNVSKTYYFNQLDPLSKIFYNAMKEMDSNGDFKKGNAMFDLTKNNALEQNYLESYVNGNSALGASFQKARDAFVSDNTEIFYVDFTKLTLRIGQQNNVYKAYLCAGANDNYFIDGINNATECLAAITNVETEIVRVVNLAKAGSTDVEKLRVLHNELVNNIDYKYDYEAGDDGKYVHSVYGALITRKSVCEGYSKALKIFMDRMEFNSITVMGFATSSENITSSHIWNYVNFDGKWYGIDATFDDPINGNPRELYFLKGAEIFDLRHIPKGQISPNGFVFEIPTLEFNNFGVTSENGGFKIITSEGKTIDKTTQEEIWHTLYRVSYNNMGPTEVSKTGLTTVLRVYDKDNDCWFPWVTIDENLQMNITKNYYDLYLFNHPSVQFAVTDMFIPADALNFDIPEQNLVGISDVYTNRFAGMYNPPPYIKTITPEVTRYIYAEETHDVTCTYYDALKLVEGFSATGENQPYLEIKAEIADAVQYTKITDFSWNGGDTISFKFKPSPMFAHDRVVYNLTLKGLVGVKSNKTPLPINYLAIRPATGNLGCPIYGTKGVFTAVAEPQLIIDKDLSTQGWVDDNGNSIPEQSLFNVVMVAKKPSDHIQEQLDVTLDAIPNAIISETYDIKLHICNTNAKRIKGSDATLLLGFPQGLDSTSVGVTYEIYHFIENPDGTYTQEIIPCVVTEYGLIAKVNSFSPFAVVAKTGAQTKTTKNIFVSNEDGGSTNKNGITIVNNSENFEVTITPNVNSLIENILFNGKKLNITNNAGFKLTVENKDLQENNSLNISYVNKTIKSTETTQGIVAIDPIITILGKNVAPVKPVIGSDLQTKRQVKLHQNITLNVNATITDSGLISYQWYKDGVALNQFGSSITLKDLSQSDMGKYHVEVYNSLNGKVSTIDSKICNVTNENSELHTKLIVIAVCLGVIIIGVVIAVNVRRHNNAKMQKKYK